MALRRTEPGERAEVTWSAVAFVPVEPVALILRVRQAHHAVPGDFRDDRGGRDREAERVAVDQAHLGRGVLDGHRVEQDHVDPDRQGPHGPLHRRAVRERQSNLVDLVDAHDADRHRRRDREDAHGERFALPRRQRFRVVEVGEFRAETVRVSRQHHGGGDKRAGKSSPPDFVDAANARIPGLPPHGFVIKGRARANDRHVGAPAPGQTTPWRFADPRYASVVPVSTGAAGVLTGAVGVLAFADLVVGWCRRRSLIRAALPVKSRR